MDNLKLTKVITEHSFRMYYQINFLSDNKDQSYAEFHKRWNDANLYLIKLDDLMVGGVTLTPRNEVGVCVLPHHQHQGIASNAIKLLMQKEQRKYYWAIIDYTNHNSIKMIQSLGYKPRGTVYTFNPR